ncbi:uncharacterized protein LOC117301092 [Asterias rubens]|uniref:uncharacterized protein LOC117301092 n=1 Tax=Asterias rubens TaxID=7604 RepID=UPI001455B6ED|nr:uncharacterized protein LOC117301092 [Asterias rubens]
MVKLISVKLFGVFMVQVLAVTSQSGKNVSNLRLAGGYYPWEGRVEVYHDGEWGTVCDDLWGWLNSNVVCHYFGYHNATYSTTWFGAGSGDIFLDDVVCIGNESSLVDCSHIGWGNHNCGHFEDIGVVCSSARLDPEEAAFQDVSVRLVGGNFPSEGRVEVYQHHRWGKVCDDLWDMNDATVVCRHLGYSSVVSQDTRFGSGYLEFILDDVDCYGNESSLANCPHAGWWNNNCYGKEAIGVVCLDENLADSLGKIFPDDFNLRLVGGNSTSEGRVELLYDDEWGTICDDGWDQRHSTVVCRFLGYKGAEFTRVQFGPGSGSIYLDDVDCTGGESNLAQCSHNGLKVTDCTHEEDVGVVCSTALRNLEEEALAPAYGSLRLVDGDSVMEGRVEIYMFYEWGTICDDNWDLRDATVVCRQLGYSSVASEHTKFGAGSANILMDGVRCNGSEAQLADCHSDGRFGSHDCSHSEDVGVVCSNHSMKPMKNESLSGGDYITYRLFGGISPTEGVLQYRSSANETWNTVCTSWPFQDYATASIFCSKVGFPFACGYDTVGNVRNSSVIAGLLRDFPSKESSIFCTVTYNGEHDCLPVSTGLSSRPCALLNTTTWLVCSSEFEYTLKYGNDNNEGLILTRCDSSQEWQGFCGNDWLDSAYAHTVASRHFGLNETARGFVLPLSILRSPLSIIGGLMCYGDEKDLSQCTITHSVYCSGYAALKGVSSSSIELRLIDSKYEGSGFVQGRHGPEEEWGAFCGKLWDNRDTQVVCRHLGYLTSLFVNRWYEGPVDLVTDSAFVSAVGCLGDETSLSQCELVFEDDTQCNEWYAYLECMAETERFDIPGYLCGEIHYCGYDCNQGPHDTLRPIEGMQYCKCDDSCGYFNDCCYDYHSNCNPAPEVQEIEINGIGIHHYSCVWTPGKGAQQGYEYFGFALVSICPDSWTNSFVAESCQNEADDGDVIGSLPVYVDNGAVYKNVFCAICHGVQPASLKKWSANLEYHFSGEPTGRYVFEPSNDTLGVARTCPVKTVNSCLEEYSGTSLERACRDYFAPLVRNKTNYRNPHCAMCNGFDNIGPDETCGLLCTPLCTSDSWGDCGAVCGVTQDPFNIETLFDFGWGGDDGSVCQPGELYDPFLERCRAVFCSSGQIDEEGGCGGNPGLLEVKGHSDAGVPAGVSNNCSIFLNTSLGRDVAVWQFNPSNETNPPFGEFTLSIITDLTEKADDALFWSLYSLCNVSTVLVYVSFGARLLSKIDTCKNDTLLAGGAFEQTQLDTSDIFKASIWARENSSFTRTLLVPQECLDILMLSCSEFTILIPEEYVSENQAATMEVLATGQVLRNEKFVLMRDGTAAVCGPISSRDMNAFVMNIIAQVCNCLSIVALVATFATYCLFPSLRSLAGLYTMNLVVALFTANCLLFFASNAAIFGYNCLVTAPLLHFSWLAAFFWMTALSYNAAKTFSGKHMRARGGSDCRKYRQLAMSMTIVWGVSLLIVCTCLFLTLCKCTDLPAIYKDSPPCWIEGFTTLMVVFGIPVALSLLLSTGFFVSILVAVRKTKMESKMVQTKGKMTDILEEVKIYVKLILLFGVTWIFAFVSEAVNHVVFSYINVIINTLQGVFIFIAFCLNQRVRALWRKQPLLSASRSSGRTSASVTASRSAAGARSTLKTDVKASNSYVNPNLRDERNVETNQKDTRI